MFVLTDSGILLRLFEPNDPLHAIVKTAADVLTAGSNKLVTATQNVAEFWNVCTRPASARGGFGLTVTQAELRLQKVEQRFALLSEPPTLYPIWRNLVVSLAVQGKQVHDARLAALMHAQGIAHILTLNGGDFVRYPGITVLDPHVVAASATPPPGTP